MENNNNKNNTNEHSVRCPNCNRENALTKAGGWKSLNELEALICATVPMLLGLFAIVLMRITEYYIAIDFETWQLLAVAVITMVITFPLIMHTVVRFSRNNLARRFGIEIYAIRCECGNEYLITRPLGIDKQADVDGESTVEVSM